MSATHRNCRFSSSDNCGDARAIRTDQGIDTARRRTYNDPISHSALEYEIPNVFITERSSLMANPDNDFPTTIGPDAFFKGHLKFEKGACLLGKFEGEISSSGELVVAQGARINADVKVDSIRIDGELKGNLNAVSKVHLSSSGHVEGDIQASRLEVDEGAVLIGRCTVGPNGKTQPKVPAKAATTGPSPTAKPKAG